MSDGGSFSMGFANAYRMMMDREEKRKEQQASKAYFDMLAQDAQAKIQPITDAATRAQFGANWADSNVAAANAPITTAPDKLADTRSLRFLSMTPEERTRAGITPEQSAQMDKSLQAEGPINMQQANAGVAQTLAPIAQQADNQAAQTQAMLQQAQQRYGTEMFGKLGALVEKGMDPRMAMKIADNHIAKSEAAALKEQMRMNVKILSDKNANPEQKQAVLAQMMVDNPQAARGLAEAFGLKPQEAKYSIAPDGRVVDMRTGLPVQNAPTYSKPDKPEKPGITFSGETFKDEEGREYQLDSRGQRHYAPKPTVTKDTRLKEIDDAEKRDLDYLRLQSSQNKFPSPAQVKDMENRAKGIQSKYQGMREGLKQPAKTSQGASLGDPLMDATLAEIRANGADSAQRLLTAKFGEEKAKQIMAQISLSMQER